MKDPRVTDDAVPLRDYMDAKFKHLEDMMSVQFGAMQKAIDLAEHKMDGKLAGMNEWRDTIRDRSLEFAKQDQVDRLQKWVDTSGGRTQGVAIVAGFISILALALTLARFMLFGF